MPPDNKKTDVSGDALTATGIRKVSAALVAAAPTSWTSYRFHYTTFMNGGIPVHMIDETPVERSGSQDPIVGYRVWKLRNGLLQSGVMPDLWPSRQRMERGEKPIHDDRINGMSHDKSIGIHAVKSERAIFEEAPSGLIFGSNGLWHDYRAAVAGEVYLWGEVKECQHGYLAEFAYPKRLWVPESMDVLTVMALEQNYGVPVEPRPECCEHIPSIWDSLWTPLQYFQYTPPIKAASDGTMMDKDDPLTVLDAGKFPENNEKLLEKGLDKPDGEV